MNGRSLDVLCSGGGRSGSGPEFPIRPFNVDVMLRQQTFAPMIVRSACNSGSRRYATAMSRFGPSINSSAFTRRNSAPTNILLFLNPRWNNFIDILDFPKHKPISRMIRHVLFGPLEDRAVPCQDAGRRCPARSGETMRQGHLIGGQVGVRFPVAQSLSVDISVQYSQYGVDFRGKQARRNNGSSLTGVRF